MIKWFVEKKEKQNYNIYKRFERYVIIIEYKIVKGGLIMNNPVIKGFYADPDIVCFNGKYYIYPTTDGGSEWNSTYFKAFSSDDQTNWNDEGIVLDLKGVHWTQGKRAWAPAAEKNGKYYFYYSGNRNIGVAVSDSPSGPFKDKGSPLVCEGSLKGQMIDPDVFIDDDGAAYLYWGNGEMYAVKLGDDMMSIDGEIERITPMNFTEGSCVFKRNGIYYYTWCKGDTRSPEYNVHYGIGTSPLQTPEGDTVILSRYNTDDRKIRCTGHHAIINIPGTDDWYIAYHRFNTDMYGDVEELSSEVGNHREICIDRLEFDSSGNIIPVKATLNGISAYKDGLI